jgi:undecaprenyl-diphosphatase
MIATVSFPSGHVGAAVAAYGGMALLIRAPRARRIALGLAVAIVVGVAFSRLYEGVHYPSDVVAGVLYGLTWLTLCRHWLRPKA